MKLKSREGQFRRVDSAQDQSIGDNFYEKFIEKFNDLVDSTGRQKIEIEIKKEATAESREYGWVDNPEEQTDPIFNIINSHYGSPDEVDYSEIQDKTVHSDAMFIEDDKVYVMVGKDKIEVPKELVEEIDLYNPDVKPMLTGFPD